MQEHKAITTTVPAPEVYAPRERREFAPAVEHALQQLRAHAGAYAARRGERFATRALEIVIALLGLATTWPIMLAVAAIIRLDSPGRAMFAQTRVGRDGRLFTFYKFRTLYVDARERFPHLYAYAYTPEEIAELQFKREVDPRVTRAGRWLRKSTLDELPNFWNLLTGDIALVGPRPEIPEMLAHYTEAQLEKFTVKPGITGLAQTHGRGRLAFQDTIAWDLKYVREQSLWLDVKIVLRTIRLLFAPDGAF